MYKSQYALPVDGPLAVDAWKRELLRPAPNNFRVTLLPPEKQGNNYSYGFCIYGESITPGNEYVVWRRWEDCLWFQRSLEVAYSRLAREKRTRLAAGKGVKKNGVYIHGDEAASWESLPFGPNPNDIAWDIHKYVPKLSKKNDLFRVSQESVDSRYQELRMMLQALLQEDLPTLIKEIKCTSTFTDFFGLWRRDVELARKAQQKLDVDRPRPSFDNILSALPLSPSSLAAKLSPVKGKARTQMQSPSVSSIHSDSSSEERQSRSSDRRQEVRSMKSRASSTASRSSSSMPSTPITAPRQLPSTSQQPVIVSPEAPVRFGHSPHTLGGERNSFSLESLPEDRELSSSTKPDGVWSRRRAGSTSNVNRNTRIYVSSQSSTLEPPELSSRSLSRYSRASLQSTQSSGTMRAAAYLDELGVDYCLPSPSPESRHFPRASVSSLASLVTNSSVDAVIPRERPSRSSSNPSRQLKEYEPWSEDDYLSEDQGDILDVYFQDMIAPHVQTPIGYPETPTVDESMYHFPGEQSTSTMSFFSYSDRRSSCTTSISSGSTSSSGNPMMISIKAMHEDNVVMLRLPRYITYEGLRQRIYDKFISTDKSTICETFAIAVIEQAPADKAEGRPRADSVSSLGSARTKGPLRFISSPQKWDEIAATHCGRLFLRIIGSRE